jgi:hypothetical protein
MNTRIADRLRIVFQVSLVAAVAATGLVVLHLSQQSQEVAQQLEEVKELQALASLDLGPAAGIAAAPPAQRPEHSLRSERDPNQANLDLDGILQRLEEIEGDLTYLADIALANQVRLSMPEDADSDTVAASTPEALAAADLETRLSQEAGVSDWGDAAASAVTAEFSRSFADKPFFRDYGGTVTPDCRETVCSLSWTPDPAIASAMTPEQHVALLEAARWQLLALAGVTGGGGQVRVVRDTASDTPTIDVFIEHDVSGGDPPEKVRQYLGAAKIEAGR